MGNNLSIEEILNNLKRVKRVIADQTTSINSRVATSSYTSLFPNLIKSISAIGQDKPAKPILTPEEYIKLWQQYLVDTRQELPFRAIRYLCWSAEVATKAQFIKYIENHRLKLFPQQIQGLVRSCHKEWDNYFTFGYMAQYLLTLIKSYEGANRVILKWRSALTMLLGEQGHLEFGIKIFQEKKSIKAVCDAWYLDEQTLYCAKAVQHSIKLCEEYLAKNNLQAGDFLIEHLINWVGWSLTEFKHYVGEAILNSYITNNTSLKNKLMSLVLSTTKDKLGDPRLPNNSRKWLGVSDIARRKLIQWLSMEDIVFFFEYVLPKDIDKHGRRSFWLKYIESFQQTRALLCQDDEVRLASTLNRNRANIGNFGKIKGGKNSAFLLDFGDVVAVEFSKVGAIYIYSREQFNRIVSDFWSNAEFDESRLKQQNYHLARIPHAGNWEYTVRVELASSGIRPS